MRKQYLEVIARFHPQEEQRERKIEPLSMVWTDGAEFPVDRILDVRPAASTHAGGYGLRFSVMIDGRQRYLWLEEGNEMWFVEGEIKE